MQQDGWYIIENIIKTDGVAKQHLNSYNEFIKYGLQSIVDEVSTVEIETPINKYQIKLGRIEIDKPRVVEHDGSENYIYPREARLRDLTYAVPLRLEMQIIDPSNTTFSQSFKVLIGNLPVMVKSDICVLNGLGDRELIDAGEDPRDPGGYFIINGSERVIVGLEDLSPNKIIVEKEKAAGAALYRATVHSSIVGFRSKIEAIYKTDGAIYIKMPSSPIDLPFVILMKALGVQSDREIAELVSMKGAMQEELIPSFEKAEEVTNTDDAILYIGNRVAHGMVDEIRIKRAEQMLDVYLLPHLGRDKSGRMDKAIFLAEIINKLLELKLGYLEPDDRDHYGNKIIKFAGQQLADIFRTSFRNFIRDMKYQLDRMGQKRGPNIITAVVRPGMVTDKITNAIATGNWGRGRVGITQLLDRTNYLSTLSHLRRIQSPLSRSQPNFEARDLHGTQLGRICPTETPEGSNCGLVKNLALYAIISVSTPFVELLKKVYDAGLISFEKGLKLGYSKVFIDGKFVGYAEDPFKTASTMRAMRRRGEIPPDVGIYTYEPENKNAGIRLFINATAGRVLRPLIIVENGEPKLTSRHIEGIQAGRINWRDLLVEGVVELLDADEEENTLIADETSEISKATTHQEVYSPAMLGVTASLIPYIEHNQSPRNTYESAMAKQALGLSNSNINQTLYVRQHLLEYPQIPLVTTKAHKLLAMEDKPMGFNAVVAVLSYEGYNIEDALVINKGSIERGMGRSFFYRLYESESQQYLGGLKDKFEIPSPEGNIRGYKGEKFYRLLESDGIISAENNVKGGDVLIGKLSPPRFSEEYKGIETHGLFMRDTSVAMRPSETGVVDMVAMSQSLDGNKMYKVRVRDHRIPELGDKFASRHGQKGVIGMIMPSEDMPFTESGVIPDLIINPHAFPSRMTVGQFLESLAGKAAALRGRTVDASPFTSEDPKSLEETLRKYGLLPSGREVMYDGITGRRYQVDVYLGVVYYQKLHHMVADKIHARARGQVQMLTKQPTEGRARGGGLRFGEMERDCLVAYGASMVLKDRLLEESDKTTMLVCERCGLIAYYNTKSKKYECPICGDAAKITKVVVAYAFKLLLQEIMSLNIAPRLELSDQV